MRASRYGFAANYLDHPSLSFPEFLRQGLRLLRDPTLRRSMSDYIRSSQDVAFFRHFHGPLHVQFLHLMERLGFQTEPELRACGLFIHFCTSLIVFLSVRSLFRDLPPIAPLLAGLTFALNKTALIDATSISAHTLFVFWAILFLGLLAHYLRDLDSKPLILSAPVLALAFATLQTAVLLVVTLVLSMLLARRKLQTRWKTRHLARFAAFYFALVALSILIVWPAGILKLGLAKSYLHITYMTFFRKTLLEGSALGLWISRLTNSWLEFVLPVLGLAGIAWHKRSFFQPHVIPYVVFGGLFFLITWLITIPYIHYHIPFMAALASLSGVGLGLILNHSRSVTRLLILALAAVTFGGSAVVYHRHSQVAHADHAWLSETVTYVKGIAAGNDGKCLVPYTLAPTLSLYVPTGRFVPYDSDLDHHSWETALSGERSATLLCFAPTCNSMLPPPDPWTIQRKHVVAQAPEGALYSIELTKPF